MKLILRDALPVVILLVILLSILRIIDNTINHKKYSLDDIFYLIYIIYIIFFLYIVTYDGLLDFEPEVNLSLFKEIFRYKIGSYLFLKNVFGNIIIFIPYGIFLKYQFNLKIPYLILVTLLFSTSIELVQLMIGRVFDIDDILLNLIGSVIGYLVIKILKE